MNYQWTEREKEIRKAVAQWLGDPETDAVAALADADPAAVRQTVERVYGELVDRGFWGEGEGEWSGFAADFELARASASLCLALQATRHFEGLVARFGDDCDPTTRLGAVALSEAAGDGPVTTATKDGDGFRLRGYKPFVTNGPIARRIAVFCRLDDREAVCLLSADQEGVKAGPPMSLMGLDGLMVGDLTLKDVKVEDTHLLCPEEDGQARRWYTLRNDLSLADACTGLMYRVLQWSAAHAGVHKRQGKPVIVHQEVRFKLAEMLTLMQTAELLCRRARWMVHTGNFEAATLVHSARVFTAENAERVASAALQVTAGQGYRSGSVAECAYRDAKGMAMAGTTVETARMAIADELLERY